MGLVGDYFQAKNASQAARTAATIQSQSADNARNVQDIFYNRERTDAQPFLDAGHSAANQLYSKVDSGALTAAYPGGPFSFTGVNLQNDPAYQFDLQQGQQAIQRSAAAQGGLVSGGAMKDLNDYSQGYASNQFQQSYSNALAAYQQAYNQWHDNQNDSYNRLSGTAGLGMDALRQDNAVGVNTANQGSQLVLDSGNALAAGAMGKANAWNGAINNANNQIMQAAMLFAGG